MNPCIIGTKVCWCGSVEQEKAHTPTVEELSEIIKDKDDVIVELMGQIAELKGGERKSVPFAPMRVEEVKG